MLLDANSPKDSPILAYKRGGSGNDAYDKNITEV